MAIAIDSSALNANALNALYRIVQNIPILMMILVMSSVLATAGLIIETTWAALLFIPQQLILMASASGSIDAMWLGQFADGVLRPHAFIAADQIYAVIIATGHTIAVVFHAMRRAANE